MPTKSPAGREGALQRRESQTHASEQRGIGVPARGSSLPPARATSGSIVHVGDGRGETGEGARGREAGAA